MSSNSGEKTEQPTEKRLQDARKKGQAARSQDLTSAFLLIAAVIVVWSIGGYIGNFFQNSMKEQIEFAVNFKGQFTKETAYDVFQKGILSMIWILTPIFFVIVVFAYLVNFLQVGSIFSFSSFSPKFDRLNPTERFKQNFLNSRPYIELGKTILRIIIAAIIVGFVLWTAREDLVRLIFKPSDIVLTYTFSLILEITLKIGIVFLNLGGLDLLWKKYLNRQALKMTKEEIKEEYKETEGNPLIKSQRKNLHQEILSNNLSSAIKNADVIIANHINISVAIKYEKGKNDAPMIAAKGKNLMAAHILQLANESGVPIKNDASLASELFELEVGSSIPEVLYESVATVLQWVYLNKDRFTETVTI